MRAQERIISRTYVTVFLTKRSGARGQEKFFLQFDTMASESYSSNLVIRKNTFFAPSYNIVLTKLTFQYHYFDVLGTAYCLLLTQFFYVPKQIMKTVLSTHFFYIFVQDMYLFCVYSNGKNLKKVQIAYNKPAL